jgi:protein TonB
VPRRDIFNDIVEPSITLGSKKQYTVSVSVLIHTAMIAAMLIIPLVAVDELPIPPVTAVFVGAPPTPSPPPPPPKKSQPKPAVQQDASVAPVIAPSTIAAEPVDKDPTAETVGLISGTVAGVTDGIVGVIAEPAPPPPPPTPSTPVHIGGDIKPPVKIKEMKLLYPAIALTTRVQGVVIIEATIGPDGTVQAARVLRSIPLLDQAALDAVRQWQYTATLLNGVPVPVIMTVTVNFTLQ